tara:strand:- start:725 stop:1561 length:837 start_codon:yes stop_codon:yes gene_type:complete
MQFEIDKFNKEGFAGPFKFEGETNYNKLLNDKYLPKHWAKSIHERSNNVVNLASSQIILEKIKNVLGSNILLWSSCFIEQKPGHQHPWHVDLEYKYWEGITIWVGLKNLDNNTPLSIISHTHNIDNFPQALKDKNVNTKNDKDVLLEAKKIDPRCELKTFYLKPGEFIVWSGKIWHKTNNFGNKKRESIILQYCSTDNVVKIPLNYDYKNMKWSENKPICILVSGEDKKKLNIVLDKSNFKSNRNFFYNLIKFIEVKYYKFRFMLSSNYRKIFQNYKV